MKIDMNSEDDTEIKKQPKRRAAKIVTPQDPLPDVFSYLDYRVFLEESLKVHQQMYPRVTQQTILNSVGITYKGFFSNVLKGRKNLNAEQAEGIGKALKLNKSEIICFQYLVQYNHSTKLEEKKLWLDRLLALKQVKNTRLSKNQHHLFSKWFFVIIRDALHFFKLRDNFADLAELLQPAITEKEAAHAITELSAMGLIQKDTEGYWRPSSDVVTTGDEVQWIQLADYQLTTMDMAKDALKKVPSKERDISYVTLTLDDETFGSVKSAVQTFRKHLLEIAKGTESPNRVFQCNIQLFPMTKRGHNEQ